MRKLFLPLIAALALAAVAFPATALAAPPANDDFAVATPISSLPFSESVNTVEATSEPGEPGGCSNGSVTVWYAFTPSTDGAFRVDTGASNYTNVIDVYSGSSLNALTFVGCGYSFQPVTFHATSGTTYYIQVAGYFPQGGSLQLTFSAVPPPPSDAFADAKTIDPQALPFTDQETALAATLEPNEPAPSCSFGAPSNSWWYAFTADASRSYSVSTYAGGAPTVAVYTGDSLESLSERACRTGSSRFSFAAV